MTIPRLCSSPRATILIVATLLTLCSAARLSAAVYRVDGLSGADSSSCGSEVSPCASIQQAVDLAVSGDTVLVAEGTYVDDVSCGGEPAVVCVDQKQLAILGGFAAGDWSLPAPSANTTVIDGQNTRRGVHVRRGGSAAHLPTTSLRLEGFTVRNCRATGAPAVGGGLKANFSDLVLRDMRFESNVVAADAGGLAGGGGVAVQSDAANVLNVALERVQFENNRATGGGGTGGHALGGGLLVDFSFIDATDLHFQGNSVVAGASASTGKEALGGAAAFSFGSTGQIRALTAVDNTATGGSASSNGGNAFGGAIYLEGDDVDQPERETALTIVDSYLAGNTATGGDGSTKAGGGVAGAINVFTARVTLERSTLIGNQGVGGAQGASQGNSGGGGIFLEWKFSSTPPLNVIRNCVIADNTIDGSQGGGGGIRLLGARAHVVHTTVVDNRILGAGFGNGILVGPRFASNQESVLDLDYSIVADHTVPSGAEALYVQANDSIGSTADIGDPNHFVGNNDDTNDGDAKSGTFVGYPGSNIFDPSTSDFFVDPANGDYHVDGTQPPTDAASGSAEALDLDGAARSGSRDMGADEFGAVAHGLSVDKAGIGTGTVTSSPTGIDCGSDCFEHYADGTNVTLNAAPDTGFYFTGWSGDADCDDGSVLMNQDRSCTAQFEDQPKECTAADEDLVLENDTVNNTVTEQACNSITAGPSYTVGSSGDVTFEAPSIILRDGFSVEGTFTAVSTIP